MTLSKKALLVDLSISQWAGRKKDKKATSNVETTFDTRGKVGQFTKKLLPECKSLKEVERLAGSMRAFNLSVTVPGPTDGVRILAAKAYLEYTKEFRKHKTKLDAAVDKFIGEYDAELTKAQVTLGDLFNNDDYPSAESLRKKFRCQVQYFPMPEVGDFRTVEISDEDKEEFSRRMGEMEKNIKTDIARRVLEKLSAAIAKFSDKKDPIFRDSLIENINDIAGLIPTLNVNDDPEIERLQKELQTTMKDIKPEACRVSTLVSKAQAERNRKEAAEKLAAISNKMSVFMKS